MDSAFWIIQGPGWAMIAYLTVAQCSSAISYELGVRMGNQEPESRITAIGVAFWWGLALADLVFYTPLLALGLVAHLLKWGSAAILLAAAFGVTVYWPIASLATVRRARNAKGWSLPKERQYWLVLPVIAAWGLIGLGLLIAGKA